eukprot:COSAG03_NODE_263_length_9732_cov_34.907194_5_plen_382_part_00
MIDSLCDRGAARAIARVKRRRAGAGDGKRATGRRRVLCSHSAQPSGWFRGLGMDADDATAAAAAAQLVDQQRLRVEDEAHAAQLTVGALVTWSLADKDIPRGTVGEIIQVKKDGTRRARFPAGHMEAPGWNFQPKNLTLASGDEIVEHKRVLELVVGVAVLCKVATPDLPPGTVGEIIEVKGDTARRVRFPMGTWVLKPEQIVQANAHQAAQWVRTKAAHAAMLVVGVSVTWTGQNDKIPQDTRGVIIAVRGDGRRRVQFPAITGWLEAGELIVVSSVTDRHFPLSHSMPHSKNSEKSLWGRNQIPSHHSHSAQRGLRRQRRACQGAKSVCGRWRGVPKKLSPTLSMCCAVAIELSKRRLLPVWRTAQDSLLAQPPKLCQQ